MTDDLECPNCGCQIYLRLTVTPKTLEDWHEDDGNVVWWTWRDGEWLGEPSYIGTPLDLGRNISVTVDGQEFIVTIGGWPGYHTHWTPHPEFPVKPSARDAK